MKKSFSVILVTLLVLALVAGSYFLYQALFWKNIDPIRAIPPDVALIIRINDAPSALGKLGESKIRKGMEILPWPGMEMVTSFFRTLNNDENARKWLQESPVCLSLHTDSTVLITAGIPDRSTAAALRSLLLDPGSKSIFKEGPGHSKGDTTIYLSMEKGILLLSDDHTRLLAARAQLGSDVALADDPEFKQLDDFSGGRVDANVFLNYPAMEKLLPEGLLAASRLMTADDQPLASWSALDLMIKEEKMLLTGYTMAGSGHDLGRLKDREAVEMTVDNILPYTTRRFSWTGIPDFGPYAASAIAESEAGPLQKYIVPWAGSEMALAVINDPGVEDEQTSFLLISIRTGATPAPSLDIITDRRIMHKGYQMNRIGKEMDPAGVICDGNWRWWAVIGKFTVWNSGESGLRRMIDTYLAGKTLDINENFASFSDNIGNDGNLLFYVNLHTSLDWLAKELPESAGKKIMANRDLFADYHGFSLQYSWFGDMALTNAVITYNENYREEDLAAWKTQLDAPLAGKPYLVYDHRSKKNKIVVFDQQNNMYLIDDYGNIIWKLQLAELPTGNVYEVDYYKNGKIQYLFNTANYLYLVDLMGRKVDNYPIRLNKSASSGLALFDYDNDRDYRLLIPSTDKKVYNYDLKGNKVKGWNEPKMEAEVTRPPQHLVVAKRDYILIDDSEGNVRITDRKGKDRITVSEKLVKSTNSGFYVNNTNNKGIILTTDQTGKLTYIGKNGEIEKTSFGDFGTGHYFLYSDFDRNGYQDFIFLDQNELYVFDRFKELIFLYEFDTPVTSPPEIIQAGRGEKLLGVVSKNQKKVFLFNSRGEVLVSSGLVGETPFTVGSLGDNDELNLLIGSGSTLYNYPLN